jgi:hypothetical protein
MYNLFPLFADLKSTRYRVHTIIIIETVTDTATSSTMLPAPPPSYDSAFCNPPVAITGSTSQLIWTPICGYSYYGQTDYSWTFWTYGSDIECLQACDANPACIMMSYDNQHNANNCYVIFNQPGYNISFPPMYADYNQNSAYVQRPAPPPSYDLAFCNPPVAITGSTSQLIWTPVCGYSYYGQTNYSWTFWTYESDIECLQACDANSTCVMMSYDNQHDANNCYVIFNQPWYNINFPPMYADYNQNSAYVQCGGYNCYYG